NKIIKMLKEKNVSDFDIGEYLAYKNLKRNLYLTTDYQLIKNKQLFIFYVKVIRISLLLLFLTLILSWFF
ncbi:MAG: hypothetical protein ACFCUU_06105, partial [Cyclobacteriaceae bacterium]